jgi:hypothetical protein
VLSIIADIRETDEARRQKDRDRKRIVRGLSADCPRDKKGSDGFNDNITLTSLTPKTSPTGEETRARRASSDPVFESEFWRAYPNKVGKPAALRAWGRAIKRADKATILAGLAAYIGKQDDRPWCNPATWLNQDRWADAPAAKGHKPSLVVSPPKPEHGPRADGQFYAKRDSPQYRAWAKARGVLGFPGGDGWYFASEWPESVREAAE